MSALIKSLLPKLAARHTLSSEEATQAFTSLLSGEATDAQIAAFLMALRMRGETIEEIATAAEVLRAKMIPVAAPSDAIDIVGTGGDGSHSLNISTATAFVVAGCGVAVAKHGNRAVSSSSGAADVLAELGITLDMPPTSITRCILEAGLGFMFAPNHHTAVKHVGKARSEMGLRTIFNLLGPMCNPARVQRMLLGVYDAKWLEPMAEVLKKLGVVDAIIVHGAGGLDEFSPIGISQFAHLRDGTISVSEITPQELGLPTVTLDDLRGGSAPHNASALERLLAGEDSAYRTAVLLNASMALVVAGRAEDAVEGLNIASASLDEGKAAEVLQKLRIICAEERA